MAASGEPPRVVLWCDVDRLFQNASARDMAQAARDLQRADREGIATVLCSSRSRAELEFIRHALDLRHPFIVEGGAAVFIPEGYFTVQPSDALELGGYHVIEFGAAYADVVTTLRVTAARCGVSIVGFGDMSVEDVARECGMDLLRAQLAKLRDYAEPYEVTEGSPQARTRLKRALQATRLRIVNRGRFNFAGTFPGIGPSVSALRNLYQRDFGSVLNVGQLDDTGDDELTTLVDSHMFVCTGGDGAVDLAAWAEGICDVVRDAREQQPPSRFRSSGTVFG